MYTLDSACFALLDMLSPDVFGFDKVKIEFDQGRGVSFFFLPSVANTYDYRVGQQSSNTPPVIDFGGSQKLAR